jgi:hypothetical protein
MEGLESALVPSTNILGQHRRFLEENGDFDEDTVDQVMVQITREIQEERRLDVDVADTLMAQGVFSLSSFCPMVAVVEQGDIMS